eukprot:TRINITY_DN3306_c0_g1_i4.p1 TRINITY_DN3306_c0_g1~~TRINITY_DN3306_c0_g1_i4.p1  ORF type:complete len:469 (-),score=90.49 TRINITY_DN3306_c0_g1_i4:141-1547(-)
MNTQSLTLFFVLASILSYAHGLGENGTILFGSSMALSNTVGTYGLQFSAGVKAAFEEINRAGGVLGGYNLSLLALDDQYSAANTVTNMNTLVQRGDIFGIVGVIGTATSIAALPIAIENRLPFVAPYTGSRALRKPYTSYAMHYRSSYEDEVAGMTSYLRKNKGVSKFSILYQNDAFGQAGYNGLIAALGRAFLPLISSGTYESSTADITSALSSIFAVETEAVILVATVGPAAEFIKQARKIKSDTIFMAVSVVSPTGLLSYLGSETQNIFYTATVPFPNDKSSTIVSKFQNALSQISTQDPSFLNLEGYVSGRLVVKGMELMYEEEKKNGVTGKVAVNDVEPSKFISVFASSVSFSLEELVLGPYGGDVCDDLDMKDCGCNQGARSVFFGKYKGTTLVPIRYPFSFSTCGYASVTPSKETSTSSSSAMAYTYYAVSSTLFLGLLFSVIFLSHILKKSCSVIIHHHV